MKKQVLVLGAGASIPYGFPSGTDLTRSLYTTYWPSWKEAHQVARTNRPLDGDYGQGVPFGLRKPDEFFVSLQKSGIRSIDAYTEIRVNGSPEDAKDFVEYASAGIFYLIAQAESEHFENDFSASKDQKNWFETFWNKFILGRVKTYEELKNVCRYLVVITFNYDRAFEVLFISHIQSTFPNEETLRSDYLPPIEVIHVYGSLGDLRTKPYGPVHKIDSGETGDLRLIGDPRGEEHGERIRDYIWNAERVLFLGFHFDPLNCYRLGLGQPPPGKTNADMLSKDLFGTALGRSRDEVKRIADYLAEGLNVVENQEMLKAPETFFIRDADCDVLIRDKFWLE